jgi:hypothetical protein
MYLNILDRVRIRTVGVSETILNYIAHEYGFFQAEAAEHCDIAIEFVDDTSSPRQCIPVRAPVAHDARGVFLYDPQYHVLRIDFDAIGQRECHVTCDRGFNPHFFAIVMEYLIHFHLLGGGATLCHCSAFVVDDSVVVCPAWRNVGKTNLLLSFLFAGATYLADDWAVLLRNGRVHSLPKRLNLLYYNLAEYPQLLASSSDTFTALVDFVRRAKLGEYDLNADAIAVLTDQARMRISPFDAFRQAPDVSPHPVDYLVLLRRRLGDPGGDAVPLDRDLFAHALASILEFEQTYFHLAYLAHKAHTGRANPYLEQARALTWEIIREAAGQVPWVCGMNVPDQKSATESVARLRALLDSTRPNRLRAAA